MEETIKKLDDFLVEMSKTVEIEGEYKEIIYSKDLANLIAYLKQKVG